MEAMAVVVDNQLRFYCVLVRQEKRMSTANKRGSGMASQNVLYTGDNLHILCGMNSCSVDLIYLDPPFNSKRTYAAPVGSKSAGASFKDMWTWKDIDEAYLEKMVNDYPYLVQFSLLNL